MEASLAAFKQRFSGQVVQPSDAGFSEATALNVSLEAPVPALVVRPKSTADVVEALRFAREAGLPISVRSGGHAASAHSMVQGGMTIHLGDMKGMSLDRERGTVHAQTGCLLGDIDGFTSREAGAKAAVLGLANTVGSGYALYGGFGLQSRRHGLCIDNILSMELVTADGRVLTLSEKENPELFWAARGAGPTLGLVTSIEHRLHDVSTFYGGTVVLPEHRFKEYNQFIYNNRKDEDLASLSYLLRTPEGPIVFNFVCHWGKQSREEKEAFFAPVRAMGPMQSTLGQVDYFQMQGIFGPIWHSLPSPRRSFWTSGGLKNIDDAQSFDSFLDAYFEVWKNLPPEAALAVMNVELYGGAINRVSKEATAYWTRGTEVLFGMMPTWMDPAADEKVVAYTHEAKAHLSRHPLANPAGYINFSMHEDAQLYLGDNLARVAAAKAQVDPAGMFHRCLDLTKRSPVAPAKARTA
jgi:hypothetical protein